MDVWWRSSNLRIIPGSWAANFTRNSNRVRWIVILSLRASSKRPCKIGQPSEKYPVSKSRAPDSCELSGLFIHEHEARKNRKYRDRRRAPACGYLWSRRDRKQGVVPKTRLVA